MYIDAVIFPSSFFDNKRIDEDLKSEYDAALVCGKYKNLLLFSYENWFHKNKLTLNMVPQERIRAVYRGWMMKPEQYKAFYESLLRRNIELITSPEEYERFHIFPNIYPYLTPDTPEVLMFPLGAKIDIEHIRSSFDRFIVKDYVKSVKGTDFPNWFHSSIAQEEFDRHMERFYELRGSLLTGGICIKKFAELKEYGARKNEYRVFYINGKVATVSRNSGQGNYTSEPPKALIKRYEQLGSPFYTIDYAECEDGKWIIIEAGDGSVSGLSDGQDYEQFYRALYNYTQCL